MWTVEEYGSTGESRPFVVRHKVTGEYVLKDTMLPGKTPRRWALKRRAQLTADWKNNELRTKAF